MVWHCTAYRDSVKVALFVSQFADVVASLPLIVVPLTLYRGTSLPIQRPSESQKRRLGFFTASRDDAFSYAKYSPRAVYIREFTGLRVLDMTSDLVLSALVGIAEGLGLPDIFTEFAVTERAGKLSEIPSELIMFINSLFLAD